MDEEIILKPLSINFYRKSRTHATLVFKSNKRVYRLPTLVNAMVVVGMLKGYELNLQHHMASHKFVFRVECVHDRHRIVEFSLTGSRVAIKVQEVVNKYELNLCFVWMGSKAEMAEALKEFRQMACRVWH
ncbi:MAG: hypothetical protein V4594_23665 [Bacteroidota bacterium]